MWFNIAVSNGNEIAVKARTLILIKMTSADVTKAQKLAKECAKKNYKGCEIPEDIKK
jgi:hypothetical protein